MPSAAAKLALRHGPIPQIIVFILLYAVWDRPFHGLAIAVSLIAQGYAMQVLLRDPKGKVPW